ncbi:putative phosphoketolase [Cladobotryum mycophilum]|uniref:Phosphoketolase n=1 Tax=Cladobotryum mycophilum TaxID=491253 RepID=A0ABR0S5T2_9HYPO
MPGEVIDRPNLPPLPSQLPDDVLVLAARPEQTALPEDVLKSLRSFQRSALYIAAAMIFLRDNVLLDKPLELQHVKPRLLGHWGTCPGLILVWSHLNHLIQKHDLDMLFVIGPGHGAPAALASLWLEGSMERFYPGEYDRDEKGLHNLITRFSAPGGHPSHINAETPGAIHEGGELGYALAVSFGAVMDNPDLLVTCVVGDGEAETGPTATAWHSIKYLDPKESGAVIPVLHVNGFKISERTIFGCMDEKELICLFSGYGSFEWAVAEIRRIQKAARSGEPIVKPRWPMIILRTPKGWTGPREVDGKIIEGSFHSHQVPLPRANKDYKHLQLLKDWLESYGISKLLPNGKPAEEVLSCIPKNDAKKLGQIKASYNPLGEMNIPEWKDFSVEKGEETSCMQTAGNFLAQALQANPRSLRIFSPDELESNKLNAVLEITGRNFQWDVYSRGNGGQVIELLSEHCCQGFLQGYTLTGRMGIFPSYESFLGIIHTMMVQYSKFVKIAREVKWRGDVWSINYIETSTWTRQEHNGFSHQNPSFIGAVLNLKAEAARVYLPPDANCFLSTLHHCLRSRGYVNLIIGSKNPTPVYLSPSEAAEHCKQGASFWDFASTYKGDDPDVVLVGIGAELTFEVVKAVELLHSLEPSLRVRMVNVTDLMVLSAESTHPHALTRDDFDKLFTQDKDIFFNYHGYAAELQGLLFGRYGVDRMKVNGYREEGTTTTPFDMLLRNKVSRYDVAARALRSASARNPTVKERLDEHLSEIDTMAENIVKYINEHGEDPEDTYKVPPRL